MSLVLFFDLNSSGLMSKYLATASWIVVQFKTFALFADSMSFNASLASSTVISFSVSDEYAITLFKAPSSSLMFDAILSAMNTITSFGTVRFSSWAFFLSIAILVSRSGACMSAIKPHSNLDLRRSSREISFGGLSLDRIICLFAS